MKLNPVQSNVVKIVKGVMDRAFARHVAQRRNRKVDLGQLAAEFAKVSGKSPMRPKDLESLLPAIGGMPTTPMRFEQLDLDLERLMKALFAHVYTAQEHRLRIEREVLADLYSRAAEYELLAQMPPERRERRVRGPRTLVERRADKVAAKVQEWERKLKYAKTKLAAYRKKHRYYTKKGAVQA